MDAWQAELYRRVQAFPVDDPQAALSFSARLAREQGWSRDFTRRVIDEYRRFAFLAVAAGHPVAPPEEVDQVWHLHLTCTRSYWGDFCAVLGAPLHHQPTRGGPDELEKHVDWYEQTIASYRRLFASEPPGDLWPPAAERFAGAARHRRVNLQTCWVIPKPRWPRAPAPLLAAFGLAPLAALANPFDLDGPQFLLLYAMLFAVALAMAFGLRAMLRGSAESKRTDPLDAYEAGCLAGGKRQAIRAAAASLVQQGAIEVRRQPKKFLGLLLVGERHCFVAGQSPPRGAAPVERAICKAAASRGCTRDRLERAASEQAAKLADRLEQDGLILPADAAAKATWGPALIMAGLAAIGAVKAVVGLSRHKPVLFLVFGIVAAIGAALFFLTRSARTRAGDRLLDRLKREHATLRRSDYSAASGADLALAVGLFGPAILVGGSLDELRYALGAPAPRQNSGGGCGGGCGGGGGGCGGCGGCS